MVYDERKSRPEVKVVPEAHWGSRTGAEFTLCVETAYAANTQGKMNLCSRSKATVPSPDWLLERYSVIL